MPGEFLNRFPASIFGAGGLAILAIAAIIVISSMAAVVVLALGFLGSKESVKFGLRLAAIAGMVLIGLFLFGVLIAFVLSFVVFKSSGG